MYRGNATFVVASIVDITERRRIEGKLLQSQKMEAIGTFAGMVAHDFNNILLGIVGYTELMQGIRIPNAFTRIVREKFNPRSSSTLQ